MQAKETFKMRIKFICLKTLKLTPTCKKVTLQIGTNWLFIKRLSEFPLFNLCRHILLTFILCYLLPLNPRFSAILCASNI